MKIFLISFLSLFILFVHLQPNLIADAQAGQPRIVTVRQIGLSTLHHPIEVYRFGNGTQRVVLIGGIHGGYEWNTVALAWQMIDHLAANPNLVPKSLSVEIVPVANPDGLHLITGSAGRFTPDQVSRKVDAYWGRFNGNGVDLNRNWDCNWRAQAKGPRGNVSGGETAMSEVETTTLAKFLTDSARNRPGNQMGNRTKTGEGGEVVGVVFWHSVANGVYAGSCEKPYSSAIALAQLYAKASGYPFYNAFTSYPINGDATDWLSRQGIPAIVVELRTATQSEFAQNLKGVQAVLEYFALSSSKLSEDPALQHKVD